jgi:hypothetical protein
MFKHILQVRNGYHVLQQFNSDGQILSAGFFRHVGGDLRFVYEYTSVSCISPARLEANGWKHISTMSASLRQEFAEAHEFQS